MKKTKLIPTIFVLILANDVLAKVNLGRADKAIECAVVYDAQMKTYAMMAEDPNFTKVTGMSQDAVRSLIRDRERSKSYHASIYVEELKSATKNEEATLDSILEKYNLTYKKIATNSASEGEILKILDDRRTSCA